MSRMAATLATGAATLVALAVLPGCSMLDQGGGDGGATTCADYLALAPEDVFEGISDEQEDVVAKMLRDHDLDDGEPNLSNAALQVTVYCGVDDTGSRMNSDSAIEDGVALDA